MPKYYNTPEFKALREEWQEKLKAEGFSDIELNTKGKVRSALRSCNMRTDLISTRNAGKLLAFYARVDQFLYENRIDLPKADVVMLELWAQGTYIYKIAAAAGVSTRTVRRRLTHYKRLILSL